MKNYHKTGGKKGRPAYRTPSSFRAKVFKIVSSISEGKMLTYKQVASKAGSPKAFRAVGATGSSGPTVKSGDITGEKH
jgi:O6-methylguanine-DNA--protein-cysteine methyltransferase